MEHLISKLFATLDSFIHQMEYQNLKNRMAFFTIYKAGDLIHLQRGRLKYRSGYAFRLVLYAASLTILNLDHDDRVLH